MRLNDRSYLIGERVRVRTPGKTINIYGTVIDVSETYGVCVAFDHGGGGWHLAKELYPVPTKRKEVAA